MVTVADIEREIRRRVRDYDTSGRERDYPRAAELQSVLWWIERQREGPPAKELPSIGGQTMARLAGDPDSCPITGQTYGDEL